MRYAIKAGLATALLAQSVAGLNAIGIKGNEFIDGSNGNRFQLIGVAYQPGGSAGYDPKTHKDPMSDADRCRRDAAVMQSIGSNTVRVYNLDPEIDHDECASIFNAAGIYMVIDVNSPLPNESLNEVSIQNSYNEVYMERLFKVVDQFAGYPNTLAFFAANELISKPEYAKTNAPYIRAVIRDMHQYMRARSGMRVVPVGYSAADIRQILKDTTNYLTCAVDGESNNDSRADFIGLNGYSWCGDTTDWVKGQYQELAQFYEGASYPLFMSEYGCNEVTPRKFNEISTIYNPKQFGMISGGLAYEYTQEDNKYGLVNVKSDNELEFLEDMDTLSAKLAGIDRSTLTKANSSATNVQIPKCEKSLISGDKIPTSWTNIPKPNSKISDLIKNGAKGKTGSIKSDVSLSVSSDLEAKWHNGSDYKFALNKMSTTDGAAGYNALGGGSVAAGAQGSTGGKSSSGAGAAITPAAQTGIFIGALTWLLASL